MTTIAVDGLNEEIFRRSIESRLRQGKAGEAVAKLRALIEPYAGEGRILPHRFLTVEAGDLELHGWDRLGESIRRHDRPGRPVTAVSISFGWAGEDVPEPDANGHLSPFIETGYFTDDAFPFSQSARDDLLDGYSWHGCTWADESEATDTVLSLTGIDDLHGALAMLEARLLASDHPDEEEVRAGSLGACLLSALLFQAVSIRIATDGLPRPLCVLSGSNGVYPYFDAPVVGIPDDVLKAAEDEDDSAAASRGVPAPRYSSLLMTGIPRAKKRAVLVVDESEEETAQRISALRNLNHRPDMAEPLEGAVHSDHEPVETDITPVPDGPLLARKHASHGWDFRDMLSPREPETPEAATGYSVPPPDLSPSEYAPQPDVERARDPASDWTDAWDSEAEPPAVSEQPAPLPALPEAEPEPEAVQNAPQPALRDPVLQERLQRLVAQPTFDPAPESDREPEICSAITVEERAPDSLGPVWPLGLGWLEADEAAAPVHQAEADDDRLPARRGLWARLRGWLSRGRPV